MASLQCRQILTSHLLLSIVLVTALATTDRRNDAPPSVNETISYADVSDNASLPITVGRGRGMMSSLGQQANHIGRGLLDLFRVGPPQLTRRGAHFPGHPPVMRQPRPFPPQPSSSGPGNGNGGGGGHHLRGPGPHVMLNQNQPPDKDRLGHSGHQVNRLEGGFMPVDKMAEAASSPSGSFFKTSSKMLSNSTIEFPVSKPHCDFYTDSLCIQSDPYPLDKLWRTVRNELPRLQHMMVDVQEQNADDLVDGVSLQEELLYTYEHYYGSQNNNTHVYRDYGADGGFVCPSDIQYVRIKRAKNLRNEWKNIVNFDDFTQTIRVEKCLKPFSRCSYVFSYLNSECIQIYNYQRLVSWTENLGFHVDIYKIPTACSCHLRSSSLLRQQSASKASSRDTTISTSRPTPSTVPDEVDHATDNEIGHRNDPARTPTAAATTRNPIKLLSQTSQPLPSSFNDLPSAAYKTPLKQPDMQQSGNSPNSVVMVFTPTNSQSNTMEQSAIDTSQNEGYRPLLQQPPPQNQHIGHQYGQHPPGNNPNHQQHKLFRMPPNFRRNSPMHFNGANQNERVGSPMQAPSAGMAVNKDQVMQASKQQQNVGVIRRYPGPVHGGGGGGGAAGHVGRPFGRFQLPHGQRRRHEQMIGHRSSGEVENSTPAHVRRVNYSKNPVSDFMNPWNV